MKLWNFIGEKACKYYQEKKNIPIEFVEATNKKQQFTGSIGLPGTQIHYILLLDRSGSMQGQRWANLMTSVKNFLEAIQNNKDQKLGSRVSIIGYNAKA